MKTQTNTSKQLRVLGRHAKIVFLDSGPAKVKAKIDTGADSSAVWATQIRVDERGRLHFVLFDPSSPYYTGKEIIKKNYKVKMVRSSTGHEQIRYSVRLHIVIDGWKFLATFTLADRSRNAFPVLVGCKLLRSKFVVDVSRGILDDAHRATSLSLTEQSKKDPVAFYETYYKQQVIPVSEDEK